VGQAHYSTLLNDGGTIEDDCLVYRFADRLMVVVNASNREKDFDHINRHRGRFDCTLEDISDDIALLAVQGPDAPRVLAGLTETGLAAIAYYHFAEGEVAGAPAVISRTGYTGEDGFELYFDPRDAARVWDALMRTGGVTPCGLGARDTLRLEAGMALYGNDIDDTVTPLEANLGWLVKLGKGDFVGRDALVRQKADGVARRLAGFTLTERAFPRPGYPVYQNGEQHGLVRSGTVSPTLGIPIGTCYLPPAGVKDGTPLELDIRGKRTPGRVVKMPFYKRASRT
jgi:aminomethyltransferase